MKIGTTIFFTILILISFGYILSDDVNVHKRLGEVSGQISDLTSQLGQANQKVNTCQATVQSDQVTISQQQSELITLQNDNSQLTASNGKLENQTNQCESALVQSKQTPGTFSKLDPLITLVILVTLVAMAILQKRTETKLSFQMPGPAQADGEYVRLTRAELAKIVSMRRMKKQ